MAELKSLLSSFLNKANLSSLGEKRLYTSYHTVIAANNKGYAVTIMLERLYRKTVF